MSGAVPRIGVSGSIASLWVTVGATHLFGDPYGCSSKYYNVDARCLGGY